MKRKTAIPAFLGLLFLGSVVVLASSITHVETIDLPSGGSATCPHAGPGSYSDADGYTYSGTHPVCRDVLAGVQRTADAAVLTAFVSGIALVIWLTGWARTRPPIRVGPSGS